MTEARSPTDDEYRWTVEELIEFAQSMDRAYQSHGYEGAIDRRKLAFSARKLARTRLNYEGYND